MRASSHRPLPAQVACKDLQHSHAPARAPRVLCVLEQPDERVPRWRRHECALLDGVHEGMHMERSVRGYYASCGEAGEMRREVKFLCESYDGCR